MLCKVGTLRSVTGLVWRHDPKLLITQCSRPHALFQSTLLEISVTVGNHAADLGWLPLLY